jgi:transposase InsO family protein
MKKERINYPVYLMARCLGVAKSGYYAWLRRSASARSIRDAILKTHIQEAHDESRKTYGSRRIQVELSGRGIIVGRDHISRLRKEMGLKCIQVKKYKATTNSKHNLPIVPNILDQCFGVVEPGTVYGTDITYIWTEEGWLYLAGVKDFATCEIIGHAMGPRMTTDLPLAAFLKAIAYRKPKHGCIHHSDKGSQYCSLEYQEAVRSAGMRPSMSGKGNCFDNAPTESFWGSLKQELIYHRNFTTRAEAMSAIQEWIEIFYNRMRRHSKIGYVAPAIYAENYHSEKNSAEKKCVYY